MVTRHEPGWFDALFTRWMASNRCALCVRSIRARLREDDPFRHGQTGPDDVAPETARQMLEYAATHCSACEIVDAFREHVPELADAPDIPVRYVH